MNVYKKIETALKNKIKEDVSEMTVLLKNHAVVSAENLRLNLAHKISYKIVQKGASTSDHFVILDNQKRKVYEFKRKMLFLQDLLVLDSDSRITSAVRIVSSGKMLSFAISLADKEIGRVESRRYPNSHFSTTIDGWSIQNSADCYVLYCGEKAVCTFTYHSLLNNSLLITESKYTDIIMAICASILYARVLVWRDVKYSAGDGGG